MGILIAYVILGLFMLVVIKLSEKQTTYKNIDDDMYVIYKSGLCFFRVIKKFKINQNEMSIMQELKETNQGIGRWSLTGEDFALKKVYDKWLFDIDD